VKVDAELGMNAGNYFNRKIKLIKREIKFNKTIINKSLHNNQYLRKQVKINLCQELYLSILISVTSQSLAKVIKKIFINKII
jgi:hypothetical protein